ncbi:MAG: hypothetical protein ACI8XO_003512, partial [Verrucomicrobiales bacterium]
MAQPIDPDIRSSDRSESPAGTVFRRLFAFWRRDEDLAPEVSPTMPQRSESKGIKPRSRAFTIWTSATNRRSGTRELSPAGRYIVDEFNGFTLWSTPEAVAGSVAAARVANQEAIASPPSRAFSTWTTPAALASQAERWKPALIKLPPSEAFTLWSQPAIREMIAPHGENPAAISLPPSQAFSTWTTPAALASQAERWKPAPIKLPPSKAFTLWSQPAIREMIAPRGENPAVISLPPSQAFSTWTTPAALASQAERWKPAPIKLPPSEAFTLWSQPAIREMIAPREENPAVISLPPSQAFSAWTTAAALASQADRWTPPLIKLPPSEAFTLWSHQSILPLLADQWEESASAGCISLTEPKPFTAWTTPEALGEMAERWSTEPMIKLKDPHPFSIWTLSSSAGKSNPANPADAAPSLPAAIRIEEPNAHSIWTTVEGLAAASARWIPSNATAKVEAIPIAFSSSTESSEDGQTERSNITPFPTGDSDSDAEAQQEPETISNFANQNNMEDHTTNPIKLANSNAFTLWSTPDKWTPNLVSASAGTPVNPAGEVESSAPAAALADTPEPKTKSPTAEQPAVSGDSDGVGFWKWAFILASVLGVGIIASQAIALGEAKENNKIEIASRLKVAGDLEMQKA